MVNSTPFVRATGMLPLLFATASLAATGPDFLLPPVQGRTLGFETSWQRQSETGTAWSPTKLFVTEGDSVFLADEHAHLARVQRDTGAVVWMNACGRATDRVLDVDRVTYTARLPVGTNGELTPPTQLDEVLCTLDAAIVSLNAHSGHLVQTQKLEKVPSTSSVVHGKYLIFGARGGQLVWQQFAIGHIWKCNELGGAIKSPPIAVGTSLAAASTNGEVMLFDPNTTRQYWRHTLAGGVQGRLASGGGAVFAASADHAIHAIEVNNGHQRWRYLTDAPLACNLFADDDRVYAQVPGEGLVAISTQASSMLACSLAWKSRVTGDAICRAGTRLIVWDSASLTLTAIDAATGLTEASVKLPGVVDLKVTGPVDPDMFLLGEGGKVQKLSTTTPTQTIAAE